MPDDQPRTSPYPCTTKQRPLQTETAPAGLSGRGESSKANQVPKPETAPAGPDMHRDAPINWDASTSFYPAGEKVQWLIDVF